MPAADPILRHAADTPAVEARLEKARDRGFYQGLAYAAGFICDDHGEESIAAELLDTAGITNGSELRRLGGESYDVRKCRAAFKEPRFQRGRVRALAKDPPDA